MISKKELLQLTGISYGQLYRWKREHLIPEEWFVKQSSYTGQETFFPREKMLERIRFIMDMKDTYSLEEIAQMLKVDPQKREISYEELSSMEEVEPEVVSLMKKEEYSFIEAALLEMLTSLYRRQEQPLYSLANLAGLLEGIQEYVLKLENENQVLTVVQAENILYGILHGEKEPVKMDQRFTVIENYSIGTILGNLKKKYVKR